MNESLLKAISLSFKAFLEKGTSRSTEKLKPLHGAIAADIATHLGSDYEVWAKGYEKQDKEEIIEGRYMQKRVDITIKRSGTNEILAGIGVKFAMQNYFQNSGNYFENMLGETANIRCNNHPYFQVFVILDTLPYYNAEKKITHFEHFTKHNIEKYVKLSEDNIDAYRHTPNKTLIFVVHLTDTKPEAKTQAEYLQFYRSKKYQITISPNEYPAFGSTVILNDYAQFIEKVYHTIKAI